MKKLLIIALVGLLQRIVDCEDDEPSVQCNMISPKSPTLRLKRHLFCEYDTSIRPVTDKNKPINVSVSLSPKFMEFILANYDHQRVYPAPNYLLDDPRIDENGFSMNRFVLEPYTYINDKTSSFILHTWMFLIWNDEHLTWKPEDFDGVDKLQVKSYEIWMPDFSIYNSGDMETRQALPTTVCLLGSTGKVLCVPSIKYNSECETDFTHWPYDTQTCDLRLGSWTHTGEEINVTFRERPMMMSSFAPHNEWHITNYTTDKVTHKFKCCPNDTFPSLIVTFDLQRHSPIFHAVYITPAIVLMIITLTVLWLDSRSIERISLAGVNFICHLLCLHDMHWILPSNGYSTPNLLLFYRNSMLLAAGSMALTVLLRKLHATQCAAPGCIGWIVCVVSASRIGKFLLLRPSSPLKYCGAEQLVDSSIPNASDNAIGDDNSGTTADVGKSLKDPSAGQSDWASFALILERLAFFGAIIAYAVLLWSRIPSPAYGIAHTED